MTEELPELEPYIEETPVEPVMTQPHLPPPEGPRPASSAGLAAPAYNPTASKEYYRFLFAGVIMFIGCMMPFGPDWEMNGYKTLGGALFTLISVGMIWSWWGAISTGRFGGANLKWVGLCIIPVIVQTMNLIGAFDAPAVKAVAASGAPMVGDWSEFFSKFVDVRNADAQAAVDNFVRAFGAGKIVLFLGSVMAELFMLMALFGGAKAVKKQKVAKSAARSGGGGGSGRRR